MERIKRFYKDHRQGCNTAITAFATLGTLFAMKNARGMKIENVALWQNDGGTQLIAVGLKNGSTKTFTKTPTKL